MEPGYYRTSFNQETDCTTVQTCKPGEHKFTPKDHKGRCQFEDAAGRRWRPTHDGKVSFHCVENLKAKSATQTDLCDDTGTREAQTSSVPHNGRAVTHLLQKVEVGLRSGIRSIRTSLASAADGSQKTQRLSSSSQDSDSTSEAGNLTEGYGQSQGDGDTRDTQAAIESWSGTDDGSNPDEKPRARV
jgi:hypothetical protein